MVRDSAFARLMQHSSACQQGRQHQGSSALASCAWFELESRVWISCFRPCSKSLHFRALPACDSLPTMSVCLLCKSQKQQVAGKAGKPENDFFDGGWDVL